MDYRYITNGMFDAEKAGRKPCPVKDDAGVYRDYVTGVPCDPPATFERESSTLPISRVKAQGWTPDGKLWINVKDETGQYHTLAFMDDEVLTDMIEMLQDARTAAAITNAFRKK